MIDYHLALATTLDVPVLRDLARRLAGADDGEDGRLELPASDDVRF